MIRLLILIVILWLLQRLLTSLLGGVRRSGRASHDTVAANNMVKDPVCGMYMDARLAVRLDGKIEPVFFCSEECRNKYLGAAGRDSGAGTPARR